jgi:tetratricopeptide (TPR) repeat protein
MIGLPQQRGSEWVSALRNIGSSDVTVKLVATTDRGEQIPTQATIPARGFGEAVFRTSSKIIRSEIDPEKLYPQVDYSNDVVPRVRSLSEGLAEATRLLSTQENVKAEVVARELVATAPQLQESRILLARALLAQNRADEAERLFRQVLDEVLPTPQAFAWGNIGLGQIALRRGQSVEAARRFTDAARAEADYATSLLARAERIRAEATTNTVPVDEAARAFVSQLDAAIKAGKKAGLEALIIPGELVRFVSGIVGTQPENWQTRVLRSEQVDAATILVDVQIEARELGQDRAGTALLVLSQNGGWKLAGIELFEVR